MNSALIVFLLYTLAVFGIAALSNQLMKSKGFLSEYFLGSRSLGVWAFALTFAATSASGGSFTGFPSLIYTYGWVLAFWIASYMIVPICTMGWLGKRLNQVARISGAITVPDVIRDRFGSRTLGLLAVLLIIFFMIFNLVAQFKAGSLILMTLLQGVGPFESAADSFYDVMSSIPFFASAQSPEYLFCLITFGIAVIFYTTYGGFHAVVWTDVMQGVVMVFGVMIMLPLAISQVGGLSNATKDIAKMTPPRRGIINLPNLETADYDKKNWFVSGEGETADLFRFASVAKDDEGEPVPGKADVLKITSPHEVERILKKKEGDEHLVRLTSAHNFEPYDYGLSKDYGAKSEDKEDFYPVDEDGNPKQGLYVTAPGTNPKSDVGFLPLSIAISFFCMWTMSGAGQPSNMVRLMAFNSSSTLKKSIATVAIYFSLIYFPLIIIFCCARMLMPGMEVESDRIMPAMTVLLTKDAGVPWLAGLLVAAPFAAVMSTVDSFLLMMSSAIVRDVYQRNINPHASEKSVKYLSYACTLIIGTGAMLFAVHPPDFLQDIIVYTGGGLSACFLAPIAYSLYWPRCNKQAILGGMIGGFLAHFSMHVIGWYANGDFFQAYKLLDFNPIITGLAASFVATFVVGCMFPPPSDEIVNKYFAKKD